MRYRIPEEGIDSGCAKTGRWGFHRPDRQSPGKGSLPLCKRGLPQGSQEAKSPFPLSQGRDSRVPLRRTGILHRRPARKEGLGLDGKREAGFPPKARPLQEGGRGHYRTGSDSLYSFRRKGTAFAVFYERFFPHGEETACALRPEKFGPGRAAGIDFALVTRGRPGAFRSPGRGASGNQPLCRNAPGGLETGR